MTCPLDWSTMVPRTLTRLKKGKVFPYSLPSVRPGADPGVQANSPQATWSESRHIPSSSLPLLSVRPAVTSVADQMALTVNGSTHLITALLLIYRPRRMKGWVGLVGWPVADGLPTLVVTHQLQVERRTGKVRQSETDVLPLCHAINLTRLLTACYKFNAARGVSICRSSATLRKTVGLPAHSSHAFGADFRRATVGSVVKRGRVMHQRRRRKRDLAGTSRSTTNQ